MSLKIRWIRI